MLSYWCWVEEEGLNILVSGSTGLIGSALITALAREGHRVVRLTRSEDTGDDNIRWDPSASMIDAARLEGINAVVHLAGESVQGRWTSAKKSRIRDSRVRGTRLLAETIARLPVPPRVMVSASATGYYGDRGNEFLREESAPGSNFLAGVCQEWEASTALAREVGMRVVCPRFGLVISTEGGALAATLPIFKLGGGGKIGRGKQYWPWVAIDDVVGAILHALMTDSIEGPVNVAAPDPPTNAEYTKTLGRVLNRPTVLPLPATAARIALGQLADELLLASQRVEPAKLKESGYTFRYPELERALRHLLGR
jgi:uncharacterized protein (TIGR01777 family)